MTKMIHDNSNYTEKSTNKVGNKFYTITKQDGTECLFPVEISIDEEIRRFSMFTSEEDNVRIIFSGIFGIGKSYFLKDFFENSDNYEAIILRPVNYIVSSNEDIFEYIKHDIAFDLLEKPVFKDGNDKPHKLVNFINKLILKTDSALNLLYKNGGTIYTLLANYLGEKEQNINIINCFLLLSQEISKLIPLEKTDCDLATSYVTETTNKLGSIYEQNAMTELLYGLINNLQEEANKKVVLVIDDLDRLDPEHIFRILNIFAAHHDNYQEGKNKYGFDKVILVCDIQNIRNIFYHKYGANVDFSGYIDKFYSKEIYEFRNKYFIKNYINNLISNIHFEFNLEQEFKIDINLISYILEEMINFDCINLRSLLKFNNKAFLVKEYFFKYMQGNTFSNFDYPCLLIFDILVSIFGDHQKLEESLSKCAKLSNMNISQYQLISDLFILLGPLPCKKNDYHYYNNIKLEITFKYYIKDIYTIDNVFVKDSSKFNLDSTKNINELELSKKFDFLKVKEHIPFFTLIKEAFDHYSEIIKLYKL